MKTEEEIKHEIAIKYGHENFNNLVVYTTKQGICTAHDEVMEEYASQFSPKWIKVTDRLPEDETVLFCTDMGYISQGYYDVAWVETFIGSEYTNVTHWMPLPEKPEV